MESEAFGRVYERIKGSREAMIDLQRRLTAVPALDPSAGGDGEARKAEIVKGELLRSGFSEDEIRLFECPDERVSTGFRPSIVAFKAGQRPERTLWIMTHLDVVSPGDLSQWKESTNPWEVVIKDGRLYGRGVADNQQDMVASIFAVRAILEEGLVPGWGVGLMMVADEETGSRRGLGWLLQEGLVTIRPDDLIVVPDAGNEEGSQIEIAEKGIVWYQFKVTGKQCHASMPVLGRNALRAGANFLVRVDDALHRAFHERDPLFDPPHSTFEPTKKLTNVDSINIIPGEDVFCFDCRLLPCYSLEEVDRVVGRIANEMEHRFGVSIEWTTPQRAPAAPPTGENAEVVVALKEAIRAIYGVEGRCEGIGGGTVASEFRRHGLPAAVWSRIVETAHQPDEYCLIDNMVGDALVFAFMMLS